MARKNKPTNLELAAADIMSDVEFAGSASRDLELRKVREQLDAVQSKYKDSLTKIENLKEELNVFNTLKNTSLEYDTFKLSNKIVPAGSAAVGVMLNDWHCAKVVNPKMLEYHNEHNLEIFRYRMQRIPEKVMLLYNLAKKFANIREFHVFVLGDLMNNWLHDDDVETNSLGPMEEMLEVRRNLSKIINTLHESVKSDVEQFKVSTCHGNHSRLTKRRRFNVPHKTNMEWQICQDLAIDAAEHNSPIQWNVSRGNMNRVVVLDWKIRLAHGDDVRYEGGIGGLTIPLIKAVKAWNENSRADYTLVAHWHQFLRLWRTVVGGCSVGYDEFAQANKCEAQPPSQTFLLFDDSKGIALAEPLFIG